MTTKITDGRYLLGVEIGRNDETSMLLVPLGPRNIPNWPRTIAVTEEEFGDVMREKARKRAEAREKAEAAAKAKPK